MTDEERDEYSEGEEGAEAEGEGEGEGGGSGLRWIIIIAVLVVLIVGAGVGAWILIPKLMPSADDVNTEESADKDGMKKDKKKTKAKANTLGAIYSLPPFIVNLNDATGKRYLKLKLDLELAKPEVQAEIVTRMPQIKDSLIILLSSKSFDDIKSVEGKMRLRMEIVSRVNSFLSQGQVKTVYFTEFVIQ